MTTGDKTVIGIVLAFLAGLLWFAISAACTDAKMRQRIMSDVHGIECTKWEAINTPVELISNGNLSVRVEEAQ